LEEYKHLSVFSNFGSGMTSAESAKCLGYPLTNKTDKTVTRVKGLFAENRKVAIHEVAKVLGI